jgi:hypothetical protein
VRMFSFTSRLRRSVLFTTAVYFAHNFSDSVHKARACSAS